MFQEADRLIREGRFADAVRVGRRLVSAQPDNPDAISLLATAEINAMRPTDALGRLERAVRRWPDNAQLRRLLGMALRRLGRSDEALSALSSALELDPDDAVTRCALSEMCLLLGDADNAMKTLQPIVDAGAWDANAAIVHAMVCQSLGREREAVEPVERALQIGTVAFASRIELLYQLGSLCDRLGEYDRAFSAYAAANNAQRVGHDPDATEHAIDRAIASWTPQAIQQMPTSGSTSQRPVLIVGLPRSGTSLVEQILSSHPSVFGGDERGFLTQLAIELDPPAPGQIPIVRSPERFRRQMVSRSSQRYLKMLDDLCADEARITDKMPINFLHLGLTQALVPGARVIHCTRDPQDTCLSCFFHNFSPVLSFSFNLEHLGRFQRGCERLMDHWKSVLDLPMLEVPYEEMVADQESMARRLVEFIGLDFDDACLRFYETRRVQMTLSNQQVRRPIYTTSLKRHEHYAPHLRALRSALGIA